MQTIEHKQTWRDLLPAIGQQVDVAFEDLRFACLVIDAKSAYGKVRLLVQPVAGTGTQWVELSRLRTPQAMAVDPTTAVLWREIT